MNGTTVSPLPEFTPWLAQHSPLVECRGEQWTTRQLDEYGIPFDDNLYDLSVEAMHSGTISFPEGVDVWCEYVSPTSIQVYATISDPSNFNAPVTVISPITNVDRFTYDGRGVLAAAFALQVVCDIASELLSEVHSMSQTMIAYTTASSEILEALAASGNKAIWNAVLANPHSSDAARTLAYLQLGSTAL